MTKRFTIEILDDENWLIEDTETGMDYNPVDGTSNVLKGLIDLVNNLYGENTQIKQTIKESYQSERTMIGKSVLKQLMETIQ